MPTSRHFDRVSWRPSLDAWCLTHLGSAPAGVLFERGWTGAAVGLELIDARRVVVKVRDADPRLFDCHRVAVALHAAGFPSPRPLVGPTPLHGYIASADELVETDPYDADAAEMADLLHRLITIAPAAAIPPGPWAHPDHQEPGRWPTDRGDRDLHDAELPSWLAHLVDDVRLASRRSVLPGVVGHCDFEAQNLGRGPVVFDLDSLATRPEAFHAGLAAAVWCADDTRKAATLAESEAFLAAYELARREPFSEQERRLAWTAGLWVDLYNAAAELEAKDPGEALHVIETEGRERAQRAGLSAR